MAKTKMISWKLAPALESKDHVRIERSGGVGFLNLSFT
jgi:hypothetical protein